MFDINIVGQQADSMCGRAVLGHGKRKPQSLGLGQGAIPWRGELMKKLSAALIAGVALACTSMSASANSISFQGIIFSLTNLGGGELEVRFSPVTGTSISSSASSSPGSNWVNINYLAAFALKPSGGTYTGASLTGWTLDLGGLNSSGCDTHGGGYVCFVSNPPHAIPTTGDMVFDVFFTGGTVDFSTTALKVDFYQTVNQTKATGDLLSQDITVGASVGAPGPIVGAGVPGMVMAGGLFGWWRRKRKTRAA
jgi:hypothetical protein